MALMRAGKHSAKAFAEALSEAEKQLVPWTEGDPRYVKLRPSEIEVRPELFQPREFLYGAHDVDKRHVKKLERRMQYKGELEPIVVIRLGEAWVCQDGHHRLAAYKKKGWKKPLKCERFKGGSVREAADASVSNNDIVKLEMRTEDKYENAWKRELTGGWSKSQLVTTCGVGERTVSEMRRAKRAYYGDDDFSIRFRAALKTNSGDRDLSEHSWWAVKQALNGTEKREFDLEAAALTLAKYMRSRIEDRLSRNPKVTARAIEIYDPELCQRLMAAFWDLGIRAPADDKDHYANERPWAGLPQGALDGELMTATARVNKIRAEVARREQEAKEEPLIDF
jgi:ParB/Sulfiredoxin domain